jgi:Tfp pilus assembly protein PilO
MRFSNVDRIWLGGGAVGTVLLAALAWFVLVSPQNAETGGLRDQQAATDTQIATLHSRLAQLRTQAKDLPQYEAQLQKERQALPTVPALADFLRELQSAGDVAGVHVGTMVAGAPVYTTAAGVKVEAVTVNVTADGNGARLTTFVSQLQRVQPRAVLVDTVRLDTSGGGNNAVLSLSARIFVAAPTAAPTATPQASTKGG